MFVRLQGKNEAEIERFGKFFIEAQKVVDSKQLRPMIRTQYMRTAFQIPFDSTVRVSLDTNLVMIKENPTDGPTCHVAGRYAHASPEPTPASIDGCSSDTFFGPAHNCSAISLQERKPRSVLNMKDAQ